MFEKESDMSIHVKNYLFQNGFDVRSEVLNFDIVGKEKNDNLEISIIELKLQLNIKLISQACNALKYAKYVYIAVPYKNKNKKTIDIKKIREINNILSITGIGLLLVDDNGIVILNKKAKPSQFIRNHFNKKLIKEFNGRPKDENVGGTTGIQQITAYKYLVYSIVDEIFKSPNGEMKSSELTKILNNKKVYSVLYNNYFKYFEKTNKAGVYKLTQLGVEEHLIREGNKLKPINKKLN